MNRKNLLSPASMFLLAALVVATFTGCVKNNTQTATPHPPAAASSDYAKDQFDVSMMLTGMITNITMLQSALSKGTSPAPTGSTIQTTGGVKKITGWDFNGMEFGRPEDLFCGANIGGTEDDQNFYVNVGYNGPDCSGQFFLKGTVILSVSKLTGWNLSTRGRNSAVGVNLNNISVTRVANNKHISITGKFSLVYYNKDTLYEPDLVASVAQLKVLKNPHKYIQQGIESGPEEFAIHYDDGSKIAWKTYWFRFYHWDGQLIITQTGEHYDGPSKQHWSDWGTDRQDRPFHWVADWVTMYENCHYKISAGTMYLNYGDANLTRDSASIVFGVDRSGNPPSDAVRNGQACQDSFYLRATNYSMGIKTSDILFPE